MTLPPPSRRNRSPRLPTVDRLLPRTRRRRSEGLTTSLDEPDDPDEPDELALAGRVARPAGAHRRTRDGAGARRADRLARLPRPRVEGPGSNSGRRSSQVGRQGAINLTTLDFEHIDADVQRILDSATGTFYDDFQRRAPAFTDVVRQVKSKSVGTVTEAAIEAGDTATEAEVLVAVTVKSVIAGQPEQQPRAWRMRILGAEVQDDDQGVQRGVRVVTDPDEEKTPSTSTTTARARRGRRGRRGDVGLTRRRSSVVRASTGRRVAAYGFLPALALILALAAGLLKYVDNSVRESAAARTESMQAASAGTIALLSYTPDKVEQQLNDARSLLTGEFLDSYTSLINEVVIPGAKQQQISAVATVPKVGSISADSESCRRAGVRQPGGDGGWGCANEYGIQRPRDIGEDRRQVVDLRVHAGLGCFP